MAKAQGDIAGSHRLVTTNAGAEFLQEITARAARWVA
jgi:hypothetical protein